MKIPFLVDNNNNNMNNKKIFKIIDDSQIGARISKNKNFINLIKKLFIYNNKNDKNNNKIIYTKASDTKKYYENLKKKK
jgi:hypothetical protein